MSSGYDNDQTLTADQEERVRRPSLDTIAGGEVIGGRYEVLERIGRGGMGVVYRVFDRKLDEVLALKLLTQASERAEERFLREVRLARKVTHPNVARTHDLGDHEGVPFLSMELIEGDPLDDVIEARGPLPVSEVLRIGIAITKGLQAAHDAGVVHRDLKPANVLIANSGRVALTDFGIARMAAGSGKQTGGLVGTPHYMSPEQVQGRTTDARSDIYALGLILFEMATAELPFDGDTPLSAAMARLTGPPRDPRSLGPMPDRLAEVVLRCLNRDPERRPGSAAQVGAALARLSTKDSSTGSGSSFYAPVRVGERSLAILPFSYRGASEHDYLGEGLAEELIDVLSRTKGLKVISLGATKRFAETRDPGLIHRELGADVIVDGTVQLFGSRVRLSARLVEPEGVQRWSDRFDGQFEDVFALQESMGRRVAEALRLELHTATHRHVAPPEALELYLRARRELRSDIIGSAALALEKLDRVLDLAPDFAPAIAAHAMAAVRAWWAVTRDESGSIEACAKESVERSVRRVPELAETHLASAMWSVQHGHFRKAAEALAYTLEIAPTMSEAHQYLGLLQLEAGRPREGKKRLQLALELDPTSYISHLALAGRALRENDLETLDFHHEVLDKAFPSSAVPLLVSQFRTALYQDDTELARAQLEAAERLEDDARAQIFEICAVALGDVAPEVARERFKALIGLVPNRRFRALLRQLVCEIYCYAGEHEFATEAFLDGARDIIVDIEWVRLCPLLDVLRTDPRFIEGAGLIQQRAANIWRRAARPA